MLLLSSKNSTDTERCLCSCDKLPLPPAGLEGGIPSAAVLERPARQLPPGVQAEGLGQGGGGAGRGGRTVEGIRLL